MHCVMSMPGQSLDVFVGVVGVDGVVVMLYFEYVTVKCAEQTRNIMHVTFIVLI